MLRAARIGLVVAATLPLGACIGGANPIVARDPVPPPPPGYRVACSTIYLPVLDHIATCRPAQPVATTVLRVKG